MNEEVLEVHIYALADHAGVELHVGELPGPERRWGTWLHFTETHQRAYLATFVDGAHYAMMIHFLDQFGQTVHNAVSYHKQAMDSMRETARKFNLPFPALSKPALLKPPPNELRRHEDPPGTQN